MNEQFANTVMVYLTDRRMSSLGNLAAHFDLAVDELIPLIQILVSGNRLRLSSSRCRSDCSACHSCESGTGPAPLSEKTIVISLERIERPL